MYDTQGLDSKQMPEQEQSVTLLHATVVYFLVESSALCSPSPEYTSLFRRVAGCLLSGNSGWVLSDLIAGRGQIIRHLDPPIFPDDYLGL